MICDCCGQEPCPRTDPTDKGIFVTEWNTLHWHGDEETERVRRGRASGLLAPSPRKWPRGKLARRVARNQKFRGHKK